MTGATEPHPQPEPHDAPGEEPQRAAPPAGSGDRLSPAETPVQPRDASAPESPADGAAVLGTDYAALQTQLAERTGDLQRLQAEYVNYKRRVDRDRQLVRDSATVSVLTGLLPVLDDVDRARTHGELTGGFKAVAESLERTVTALGLVRFGAAGEPFDPRVHEALMHEFSDEVDGPTAQTILQPGYRIGERIVRPARVAVAEPAATVAAPTPDGVDLAGGTGGTGGTGEGTLLGGVDGTDDSAGAGEVGDTPDTGRPGEGAS